MHQPKIWQSTSWNASSVHILTSNFEQKTWNKVNFLWDTRFLFPFPIFDNLIPYFLSFNPNPFPISGTLIPYLLVSIITYPFFPFSNPFNHYNLSKPLIHDFVSLINYTLFFKLYLLSLIPLSCIPYFI